MIGSIAIVRFNTALEHVPPETDAVVVMEITKPKADKFQQGQGGGGWDTDRGHFWSRHRTRGEVGSYHWARRGRTPGCCGGDLGPGVQLAHGLHPKQLDPEAGEAQLPSHYWRFCVIEKRLCLFYSLFQIKSVRLVVTSGRSTQTQWRTVWSIMIVPKVLPYKDLKKSLLVVPIRFLFFSIV